MHAAWGDMHGVGVLEHLDMVIEALFDAIECISLDDLPPGLADVVGDLADAATAYAAADKTR